MRARPGLGRGGALSELLFGFYFEPEASFADALRASPFWVPLVALMALNLAFTAVWLQRVDAQAFFRAEMEHSGAIDGIPPERLGEVLATQTRMLPILGWVGGLLGAPAAVLLTSAAYTFVLRFFLASRSASAAC